MPFFFSEMVFMNLCVEKPIWKGKQEFAKDNANTKRKEKERKKKSTVRLDICITLLILS